MSRLAFSRTCGIWSIENFLRPAKPRDTYSSHFASAKLVFIFFENKSGMLSNFYFSFADSSGVHAPSHPGDVRLITTARLEASHARI
jgi:hypothetical protein